ncbi:MAG TPA: beta-propeller fold lactonase family protein [Longimicrobiales bacterium]|nr:beta-propeller fold lactonase family protein [Longimicrobiales bacterium]
MRCLAAARHAVFCSILVAVSCGTPAPGTPGPGEEPFLPVIGRLPTGHVLDPAGSSVPVGALPLAMEISPDGRYAVLLLNGWREQGVQVVDRFTGEVTQTALQAAAFLGLAFAPDGRSLYASGGNQDVVYRYDWSAGRLTLRDSLVLATKPPNRNGTRYPAQFAFSGDGRFLYVAENLADSLAVVDVASGLVLARHPTDRYPYGVTVAPDGTVYVSAWGDWTVSVFRFADDGSATEAAEVEVGRHPSALLLNRDGSRLFIASGSTDRVLVMDTRSREIIAELEDAPPEGPGEGSTPNALALSDDGRRLFVAEADNNAVAVFDLSATTGGYDASTGATITTDRLAGRIPVEWYPAALTLRGDSLLVANAKGRGTAPNPGFPQPPIRRAQGEPDYTHGQISGTLATVDLAGATDAELAPLSARVARANGWEGRTRQPEAYPPLEHVIYIVKENRTYDQVFGDIASGDGDTALVFFPRSVSPNHHALAERFGLFDRFFVNAESSPDGHNWSMAAYTTDYLQKTVPSNYSSRGRSYDYEGTNRGFSNIPWEEDEDDVSEPAMGYLWDLAEDAGITFRNFGEFVIPENVDPNDPMPTGYKGNKPFLVDNTSRDYPGYNLDIPDQRRADVWIAELQGFVAAGAMPQFQILRLPNDHTAGGRGGAPTPQAYMADNDLALGRIIEALSRTPFWENTVVFVLEDDAQNGPDHVDSHRSVFLAISPWTERGVHHRWTNTTDVVATMTEILDLGSLSQFDFYGRPLRGIWADEADTRPYTALVPETPLDQRNPAGGQDAEASEELDLRFEDSGQDDLFNEILWRIIKGDDVPYPGATRMSALEWKRGR